MVQKGWASSFIHASLVLFVFCGVSISRADNSKPVVQAKVKFDGERMVNFILAAPAGNLKGAQDNISAVIDRTERKPYREIIEALFQRAAIEVDKGNFSPVVNQNDKLMGMDIQLVSYLIETIGKIAPADAYSSRLEALIQKVTDLAGSDPQTRAVFEKQKYADQFRVFLKRCLNNKLAVIAYSANGIASSKSLDDELKEFRARLENEVKGQPEVVDALVAIRQKDLVYGYREYSPSIWLLGLPGVGKDTSARAYTNAINNDPEAWKKHMYTISPLVGKEDLWSILGSGTGYVGSENFPPFLQFLVDHSGGRYIKNLVNPGAPPDKQKYQVIENPEWSNGDTGDTAPERAVLYLDEFHKWSKDIKDLFVKKALESDGTFRIYNPNEGLDKISVPITIIIGSNDGISLLASREKNGQRFGEPLSYEQMLEKQQRVAHDTNAISGAILGGGSSTSGGEIAKGTSEELLNRVKTVIVMRPLSPEQLREIADHKLHLMLDVLSKSRGGYENVSIEYTPAVVNLIQEFQYVAEDNARPIEKRIETLFQEPLFQAFRNGVVKRGERITLHFDVRKEADNTYSGVITFPGAGQARPEVAVPIRATETERAKRPISDEELMVLDLLPEQLKSEVVGQDHAMEEIAETLKLTEEGRTAVGTASEVKTAARTFLLLGYSSVGKTQTGKAVAKYLLKNEEAVVTISFSPNMTEEQLNDAILGRKDYKGDSVDSEFMKAYDRAGGRLVVLLDEVANVRDKDLLNKLYDLFREPTVTTFSDGHDRVMSNVIFLVTGNAGQELHKELPAHLPEVIRREAMQEVHRRLIGNPNLQREIYEQYFSSPLLARIGDDNIFNYGPLDYLAAGKLVQLKMKAALNNLKPKQAIRGWNVVFKDAAAYTKIVDAIEKEGFNTREQGASIDHFVQKKFQEGLRKLLLGAFIPDGSQVVIDFGGVVDAGVLNDDPAAEATNRNEVILNVSVNGKEMKLAMEGIQQTHDVPRMKREMILTAYHEAGHSIVRSALMGDYYSAGGIKVIPGVAHIAGQWVHYEGVASANRKLRVDTTREFLVREIAVLFGGAVAEDLIVKGGYSSHGKQNDMQRATSLAQIAILDLGLVPEWGLRNAKLADLSEADHNKLNLLVESLLAEGRDLAVKSLRANAHILQHLGNDLARNGELDGQQIEEIYRQEKLVTEMDDDFEQAAKDSKLVDQTKSDAPRKGIGYTLVDGIQFIKEDEIVDLVKILEAKRDAQISQLTIPAGTPLLSTESAPAVTAPSRARGPGGTNVPPATKSCDSLLKGA